MVLRYLCRLRSVHDVGVSGGSLGFPKGASIRSRTLRCQIEYWQIGGQV